MSQFGCRISVMLGGVISALGLGLGMFVTNIYHVYLTFGVLTGTEKIFKEIYSLYITEKQQ